MRCYLSPGAGTGLAFTVTSCAGTGSSQRCYTSAPSTEFVSYPAPTIKPTSLRLASQPLNKTAALALSSTLSTEIAFDGLSPLYQGQHSSWCAGTNFYPPSMSVTYGPTSNPSLYSCTVVPAASSSTTVACYTASFSDGQFMCAWFDAFEC